MDKEQPPQAQNTKILAVTGYPSRTLTKEMESEERRESRLRRSAGFYLNSAENFSQKPRHHLLIAEKTLAGPLLR